MESFIYANAAARGAASGFVAGDVGRIAYQTDTGEYWRVLSQSAGVPTWALAGLTGAGTAGQILTKNSGTNQDAGWATNLVDNTAWSTYTPTVTGATGTFTTVSGTGRYKQIGKTVHLKVSITITTNGTAATAVNVTLPVVPNTTFQSIGVGRENAVSAKMLQGIITAAPLLSIQNYDNTYPGANGALVLMSITYEAT